MNLSLLQRDREIEREEDALRRELDDGEIALAEYNKALRELRRDYAAAAEEAACDAYDREKERW